MKILNWYKKNNLENKIFYSAWALLLLSLLLSCTAWWHLNLENGNGLFSVITRAMKYLAALLCCIVILFSVIQKKYNLQAIIGYGILFIVLGLSAYFSKNTFIFSYWFFFAAAYKQNAKKLLQISTLITAGVLFIVVLCSQIGLAENIRWGMSERYGLGFGWCTTAPILYFFFMLQYIVLRKEKIKIWEFAILEIISVYFFVMTRTQMAFYLGTVCIVFFAIQSIFKEHWKILKRIKWVWIVLPVLIFVFSVLLYLEFNPVIPFWNWLNVFIHHRLDLGANALSLYGITCFGQPIEWVGYGISGLNGTYNYVDCSYLQIMLEFGIATIVAVVAIYILGIYNAAKKNNYWLVFAFLFAMALSVTEPRLMNMEFNILPILAFMKIDEEGFSFREIRKDSTNDS